MIMLQMQIVNVLSVFVVGKMDPGHKKTCLRRFATRSDSNQPIQL